jgi:hypothetical protein
VVRTSNEVARDVYSPSDDQNHDGSRGENGLVGTDLEGGGEEWLPEHGGQVVVQSYASLLGHQASPEALGREGRQPG